MRLVRIALAIVTLAAVAPVAFSQPYGGANGNQGEGVSDQAGPYGNGQAPADWRDQAEKGPPPGQAKKAGYPDGWRGHHYGWRHRRRVCLRHDRHWVCHWRRWR
ncbi:MAG TPA: hypothetical protein VGS12_09370 [Caulobacteraceae bacterium]|nr:hypothetical protein [Caulobacteraceae bacterium]